VDDIRTLVDQVRFAPQAGKYKVYIIDEVHMLTSSAFNAFLKTLEEPPPYAVFILATTEKHKIIPTILSRCQIFDFKRITLLDTVEHLAEIASKEEIKADKASLQLIAQKSEGCMRDALSILDKIVSFTNGDVNYNNTLEHLNILDADYYFKLIHCMQAQDLSGAMLLYDDINRKGFEGDMVLNGFSEFLRNLLVSMDEKVAVLLDVVESFKEKYISTAKKMSAAYLVSALNILNESEINYKSARNKRLHVELTLIKLCYLQQALEISSDSGKKKMIETAKPVAFRQIIPIEIKPAGAKLVIEESRKKETEVSRRESQPMETTMEMATLTEAPQASPQKVSTKLAALNKIRDQYKSADTAKTESAKPLDPLELQQGWDEFTLLLKQQQNAAWQNFEMAVLQIVDPNSFLAKTTNNIQFRFIETNGLSATEFLKKRLQNNLLQFFVVMEENKDPLPLADMPLSSRQQFQKMIEEYPLVRELKERLKLDLDY
jgi:DNA polymerase-3 subunit gamma/tau